ncbi:MAG: hypothetical protein FWH11_12875 [Micrococcales bacterium]|nr:hypothetical protein [Micrococcales bacterium]
MRTTARVLLSLTIAAALATLSGCSGDTVEPSATGTPSAPAVRLVPTDEEGLDDDGKGPAESVDCELVRVGQICIDGEGDVAITWTRGYPHEGSLDFSRDGTFSQIDPLISDGRDLTGRWETSGETVLLTYSDGRLAHVTFASGDQPDLTLRLDADPNNPIVYNLTPTGRD